MRYAEFNLLFTVKQKTTVGYKQNIRQYFPHKLMHGICGQPNFLHFTKTGGREKEDKASGLHKIRVAQENTEN